LTVVAWAVVVWGGVALVIAISVRSLREQLAHAVDEGIELLRQAEALSEAAGILTSLQDPQLVLREACRLGAEMVSPVGVRGRRAQYIRIKGDTACLDLIVAEFDHLDIRPFSLSEHPARDPDLISESGAPRRI